MRVKSCAIQFVIMVVCVSVATGQGRQAERAVDPAVWVRDGYTVSVAANLEKTRFMAFGPDGTLYVSLPDSGQIRACRDEDDDGYYGRVVTFVKDHPTVHGMLWYEDWLWFTESGAVFKGRDTDGDGAADEQQVVIPKGQLPTGGHWWRPILIHKGRLYTGIGDSGNITDESATDRQKIWRYNLEGQDKRLFISGIRNTEKLVVRPGTDEVWGMDHGSDWFGRVYRLRFRRPGEPPAA